MSRPLLIFCLILSLPATAGDFEREQAQWCSGLLLPVRTLLRQNVEELERTLFYDEDRIALSLTRHGYLEQLDGPVHADRVGGRKVVRATAHQEKQFPGIGKMLAYVTSAGGELRRHPRENFFIDESGRPIVRFHTPAGLSHEMDHFRRWFFFKTVLLASAPRLDERTAGRIVEAAFFTGAGSFLIESSGILVCLRERPKAPSSSGASRDFRSFISQISYPYHCAIKGAAGDLAIAEAFRDNPASVARAEAALADFTRRYVAFLRTVQAESQSFWHAQAAKYDNADRRAVGIELVGLLKDSVGSGVLLDKLSPAARALYFRLELDHPSWVRQTALEQASLFDFEGQAQRVEGALRQALDHP